MPMISLPLDTPSLRLRHIVVDEALRMMELNGEPSRRTLQRAGFVHGADTVMRFQGAEQTVSRYFWRPGVGK